jgi:EmrB/QacA subfamily drug resistance transporter
MPTVIKNPWLLFFGVAVGPFMAGVDFLIIAVAAEPMARALAINIDTLQWFLTAFAIGNASFLVTSGRLADIYGRRKIYMTGLIIFIISSLIIVASSFPLLIIIARLIQGASTGVMSTTAVAIMANAYPPEQRAGWMAAIVAATGLGMVVGPSVGGFLIHHFSWPSVFLINVPVGLFGLLLTVLYVPKQLAPLIKQKLDLIGVILLTITLILFTIAITRGQLWGWSSEKTLITFALSALLFIIFIFAERKCAQPLIEFPLFKVQNFLAANAAGFIAYFSFTAWVFIFGVYLQRVVGLSAQDAGISLLPFGLMIALFSALVNKWSRRLGVKRMIILGCAFGILAFGGMSKLDIYPPYWQLMLLFALYGVSFLLVNACSITAALQFMPPEKSGIASGKTLMLRWLGGAIGAAVMATIFMAVAGNQMRYHRLNAAQAYHQGLIVCMMLLGLLALLALLISYYGIKQKIV